ncbi:phosphoribosyltransferase-like protein [Serratia surfactantfaciens]|uniref:phosphoribosyltransferase-like protein n=1 Tax=Serratia surfactantfaciens TaxID=2741499 RepID=UPI003EE2A6B6
MDRMELEGRVRELINHAWDDEVKWSEIDGWVTNFKGDYHSKDQEQLHAIFSITQYMYFGRRLVREMLKSLFRDHFCSPLKQRIRRNYNNTLDFSLITRVYKQELQSTRFIGVGNPSESGAHLLYYFRQVNGLSKNLFCDLHSIAQVKFEGSRCSSYDISDESIKRIVFFDDIVGSGTQASEYLGRCIQDLKKNRPALDIRFMSLFSTTEGLTKLNSSKVFDGSAMCLFELDNTYKCFDDNSRYFQNAPKWFSLEVMKDVLKRYGEQISSAHPLGYKNGQLLISFSHNTPDNVPPVYWHSGAWKPAFLRYQKL